MNFKRSESREKPIEVEKVSGGRHYVRKNITTEEREMNGETVSMWVYEEALMSDVEYAAYSAVKSQESKRENEIIDEYTLQLIDDGVI